MILRKLTLCVGRGLTSTLETWLLAFFDTRIASKKIVSAHSAAQGFVHGDQGAGQTKLDCVALTANAAAFDFDSNIKGCDRTTSDFQCSQNGRRSEERRVGKEWRA